MIRKGVTEIEASRLHILEASVADESVDESFLKNLLGEDLHKLIGIEDHKFICIMCSVHSGNYSVQLSLFQFINHSFFPAFTLLQTQKDNKKVSFTLLEKSASKHYCEFSPTPTRPATNPQAANRILSSALS